MSQQHSNRSSGKTYHLDSLSPRVIPRPRASPSRRARPLLVPRPVPMAAAHALVARLTASAASPPRARARVARRSSSAGTLAAGTGTPPPRSPPPRRGRGGRGHGAGRRSFLVVTAKKKGFAAELLGALDAALPGEPELFRGRARLTKGKVSAKRHVPPDSPPAVRRVGISPGHERAPADPRRGGHRADARERLLAARSLDYAESLVKPGVTTDFIDRKVHGMTIDNGAYPSPSTTAASPNPSARVSTSASATASRTPPSFRTGTSQTST